MYSKRSSEFEKVDEKSKGRQRKGRKDVIKKDPKELHLSAQMIPNKRQWKMNSKIACLINDGTKLR